MRKVNGLSIFLLFIILISCSIKENPSNLDVKSPKTEKHKIVGRWLIERGENYDKRHFELTFSEDENLKVNSTYSSENETHSNAENYKFRVLDQNRVEFDYDSTGLGEPLVIVGEVTGNKLKIRCQHKSNRKKNDFTSPPILCFFNDFEKIENTP